MGHLETIFLYLVCLWKLAAKTVVTSEVLSYHRCLGCFKKAGFVSHFSLILLSSIPRATWPAGFRVIGMWCHCSWWSIYEISVIRITTWKSFQTCKTAVLSRWSSLHANDKRRAPSFCSFYFTFWYTQLFNKRNIAFANQKLTFKTVSSELCIRKNRSACTQMTKSLEYKSRSLSVADFIYLCASDCLVMISYDCPAQFLEGPQYLFQKWCMWNNWKIVTSWGRPNFDLLNEGFYNTVWVAKWLWRSSVHLYKKQGYMSNLWWVFLLSLRRILIEKSPGECYLLYDSCQL